jgi:Domain of unknown function (DUF4129)
MPAMDKATGRVAALVVLMVIAAAALRGYLPGHEPAPRDQTMGSPAAFVAVVALLTVSIAIVALAVVVRLRDRRSGPASAGHVSTAFRGSGPRPTWRTWLIGLGVLVAWLLIVALLARLGGQHDIGQLPTEPESSTPAPGNGTDPPSQPAPDPPPPGTGPDVFGYLAATTVALLLLLAAGTVIASHRQRRGAYAYSTDDSYDHATPAAGPESLARAAEVGLAEIGDLSREPREAIIACYAAMERELAHVPGAVPQDFDTPSEVLARAVEHHAMRADNATQLVELFAEARFSPHVMTERHREAAIRVLRLVLTELAPRGVA